MSSRSGRSTSKKTPKTSDKPEAETRSGREFPGDEKWNEMIALFHESGSAGSARMDKLRASVIAVATLYELHDADWPSYLAERHVKSGKRGPTATSEFHSLFKLGLSIDAGGDKAGMASMLSHVVDEWVETARNRSVEGGGPVSAAEIDGWIGERALKEVAKLHRDRHSDNPIKEEKEDAFLELLDLEPLCEMPLPDMLAGHVWVRPLFRVVDDRLLLIDAGQTVSQGWLVGNAPEIIKARGVPVEQAAARAEVGDADVKEAPPSVECGDTKTADGRLLTVHGVIDRHKARSATVGPMLIRDHLDRDCQGKDAVYRSNGTNDKLHRQISRLLKDRLHHDLVGSVYALAKRGAKAAAHAVEAVPDVVSVVREQFATVAAVAASVFPADGAEPAEPEIVETVEASPETEPPEGSHAEREPEASPPVEAAAGPDAVATENQYVCRAKPGTCQYGGCAAAGRCLFKARSDPGLRAVLGVERALLDKKKPGDASANEEDDHDGSHIDPESAKHIASIRENLAASQAMLASKQSAEPKKPVKLTQKAIRLAEGITARISNGTLQREHVFHVEGGEWAIIQGTENEYLIDSDFTFRPLSGGVEVDLQKRIVTIDRKKLDMSDVDFKRFTRTWRKLDEMRPATQAAAAD
jgi:hypothetical protein